MIQSNVGWICKFILNGRASFLHIYIIYKYLKKRMCSSLILRLFVITAVPCLLANIDYKAYKFIIFLIYLIYYFNLLTLLEHAHTLTYT